MKYRSLLVATIVFVITHNAFGQNSRLNTNNTVGWYNYFGTVKLSNKFGLHTEYQWRRNNVITTWQQSLLRVGLNYNLNPRVLFRVGYAWIETFPYGEYPINSSGRDFTEHRTFQMATLTDKIGRLDFAHRFMLEQRWIGRYTKPEITREDEYFFVNRLRYMFRMQCPLQGNTLDDKEFYLAAYDEIFIGFGKNVNENVFDQNRIGLLAGYRFNKKIRIEGGYFNQILQLPREVVLPGNSNGRNVFQHNNGIIVNAYFNLDLNK